MTTVVTKATPHETMMVEDTRDIVVKSVKQAGTYGETVEFHSDVPDDYQ